MKTTFVSCLAVGSSPTARMDWKIFFLPFKDIYFVLFLGRKYRTVLDRRETGMAVDVQKEVKECEVCGNSVIFVCLDHFSKSAAADETCSSCRSHQIPGD